MRPFPLLTDPLHRVRFVGSIANSQFAISGSTYYGVLRILKDNRYSVNKGKAGKFTMSGSTITWKSGVYKGVWRSKLRRARGADRTLTIGHFAWKDRRFQGDEEVSCYKDT